MKKFISLFLFTLSFVVYSQDYYPKNRSFTLETSISTGITHSLSDSSFTNGKIVEVGIDSANIYKNAKFGLIGGYSYIYKDSDRLFNAFTTGFRVGFKFKPLNWLSLTPTVGFLVNNVITGDDSAIELTMGNDLDFHIFQRNMLFIRPELSFNMYGEIQGSFKLLFGIKRSIPVFLDVPPIKYNIVVKPKRFSPDNDGIDDVMKISVQDLVHPKSSKNWTLKIYNEYHKVIYATSGFGIPPETIKWSGIQDSGDTISSATDYFIEIEIVDYLGNKNIKKIEFLSDILIEQDGSNNKIRIDSIIFPPNSENLTLVSEKQGNKNSFIINSIALKLKKYPDYDIRIEGHGNVIGTNLEVLMMLTTRRAQAIKDALVLEGMDANRISVVGRGGDEPVVPFNDKDNWKNRRVEFILLK